MGSAPAAFADKFVYERRGALRACGTPAGAKPRRVPAATAGTCAPGAVSHATHSCPGQHISCDCDYPQIITLSYAALVRRICAAKTAGRSFDQTAQNVRTVHNAVSIRYLGYS